MTGIEPGIFVSISEKSIKNYIFIYYAVIILAYISYVTQIFKSAIVSIKFLKLKDLNSINNTESTMDSSDRLKKPMIFK